MRKIVAVASVAGVLGAGSIGYSLIRTGEQIGRLDAALPAPNAEPARVQPPPGGPIGTPVVAAPAADEVADVADEPLGDGLNADERSPFGHATEDSIQPAQETTIAEGAPRDADADGDATSLPPLLIDARETLSQLLAEAEGDADVEAELGALLGSSAPLDVLLEDSDPAVREEAAKLLEVLGRSSVAQ